MVYTNHIYLHLNYLLHNDDVAPWELHTIIVIYEDQDNIHLRIGYEEKGD